MKLSLSRPALGALLLCAPVMGQTFQLGDFVPAQAGDQDRIGFAVDVDGDTAIVGARDDGFTGPPPHDGGAYVLRRAANGAWELEAQLIPSIPVDGAEYGHSVAIDGNLVAVGAPTYSGQAGFAGAVFIYERVAGDVWVERSVLEMSSPASGDQFGRSVDLDGTGIVVGAPFRDHPVTAREVGMAFVYSRSNPTLWTLKGELTSDGADLPRGIGSAVSMDAGRAAVGAPLWLAQSVAGEVLVFTRTQTGLWVLEEEIQGPVATSTNEFGASVALVDDLLAIGAFQAESNTTGAAYLHERSASGSWPLIQSLISPSPGMGAWYGEALDFDGTSLAVGEPRSQVWQGGATHLYQRLASGTFGLVSTLLRPNAGSADQFGGAVAVDRASVLVGSPQASSVATNSGLVSTYWSYELSDLPAPFQSGSGTAGCNGPQQLFLGGPALIANGNFSIRGDNAPPNANGLLLLGDVVDAVGSDPFLFGLDLHVDLIQSSFLLTLPLPVDPGGFSVTNLPLPDKAGLVGVDLVAQGFYPWTTCSPSAIGFSSTSALTFRIGAF